MTAGVIPVPLATGGTVFVPANTRFGRFLMAAAEFADWFNTTPYGTLTGVLNNGRDSIEAVRKDRKPL